MIIDHSNYDSFHWMDTFGDPGWFHHQQIAQMLGLTALRLATSLIVAFNATAYTEKLENYVGSLSSTVLESSGGHLEEATKRVDLKPLEDAVKHLAKYAKQLDSEAAELKQTPKHQTCYLNTFCISHLRRAEIDKVNKAYLQFERSFIGRGLPGRPIYKHVIYAPGTWDGYAGSTFPSIREAVAGERWAEVKEQIREITRLLEHASSGGIL
jgi:N-acetylated-alpha-linked acidic dipeptidase